MRAPPVLPAASTSGPPRVFKLTDLDRASAGQDSDSGRGRSSLAVAPGGFIGSDQYCIRNPCIRPRTVLVRGLAAVCRCTLPFRFFPLLPLLVCFFYLRVNNVCVLIRRGVKARSVVNICVAS